MSFRIWTAGYAIGSLEYVWTLRLINWWRSWHSWFLQYYTPHKTETSMCGSLISALGGVVVNTTLQPLYPREWNPLPIIQEAGWAAGPIWTGAGHLAPIGSRSPDRPARSEPLYRLRHPGLRQCTVRLDTGTLHFQTTYFIGMQLVRWASSPHWLFTWTPLTSGLHEEEQGEHYTWFDNKK